MASIITATTTSGLTQSADNSGVLQIASGTGNLVTIPSVTGTAMVSGNMPAFNVALSSNQSVSATTWTKIAFNSENFDTANAFDSTANYRFTPQVAGYYQLNASAAFNGTVSASYIALYKNGTAFQRRQQGVDTFAGISTVIYLNGSTDYVEAYVYLYGSPTSINGDIKETFFSGSLARSA